MSESVIAAAGGHVGQAEPSRWVAQWARLVPAGGAVLDVAAGGGRHAGWVASRGHPVVALDRDPAALAALRAIPGVDARAADLEGAPWPLPAGERFAAVIVTNYLHRPLWPHLLDAEHLALDQGPVALMIENYRSGLLWRLMHECPAIVDGLRRAGFRKGWLGQGWWRSSTP